MHVESLRGVPIASCPARTRRDAEQVRVHHQGRRHTAEDRRYEDRKRKTTDQPAPPNWPSPHPPIRVEIDWSAAGQSQKWFYLYAVNASGTALVQRLAN